jgi:DNA mismatch repair ATPase MutS
VILAINVPFTPWQTGMGPRVPTQTLEDGQSRKRLALEVAEKEGVDPEVIAVARKARQKLETLGCY